MKYPYAILRFVLSRNLRVAMFISFAWALSFALFGGAAHAATMPEPNRFVTNSGNPKLIRLLYGVSGTISVPDSYIKVYSTVPNPTISFSDISACSSTITIQSTNASQATTTTNHTINLSGSCGGSINRLLSGSALANVGSEQYYVWVIHFQDMSGLTYLRVSSGNADFGYIGRETPGGLGSDRFALQNSYDCAAVGSFSPYGNCMTYKANATANYTIRFATPCGISSNTPNRLRWYDDDQNSTDNQNNNDPGGPGSDAQHDRSHTNMRFDIYDETDGTYVRQNYRPQRGNDESFYLDMTFEPGHKYRWVWKNVADSNGIQFQLPYDSFFYNVDCSPPLRFAVFNASCTHLGFHVTSTDNSVRYNVRVIIDGENGPLLDNGGAGYPVGQNHVFNNNVTTDPDVPYNNYRDFSTHDIRLRVRNVDGSGIAVLSPERTIGPCATASCVGGPTVVGGGSPTPGDVVRIRQHITTNMGTAGNPTLYSARLTAAGTPNITAVGAGPPGTAGTWTADASQAIVSGIGYPASPTWGGPDEEITWDVMWPAAGNYDTSVTITGPVTLTCSSTGSGAISVTQKPYLRVWGGDVLVGCSGSTVWGTTASDPGRGKILAFSRSNGTLNRGSGSGSTLLVQALQGIEGFSSSQRAGMPMDSYLTLANSGSGVDTTWGGSYGGSQCASDFYAVASASPGTFPGMPTASGSYTYAGPVTLSGAAIPAGRNITIYVDGDVTITGNITYAGASTGWGSLSDIPAFKLVAKGNIKVSRTVSELSGTYVAQPQDGGNGGTIYTCTNGITVLSAPAPLISQCSSPLTVYGAFIAKSVKFLRLSGSLNSSVSPTDSAATSTAAEKFIYGPEAWMKAPATSVGAGAYDSITSLPPAF
ncbi:hypothetical protein E6P97_02025 [Patescibacteria group bacterium]|nr:MAG: hypothetical protein E6P97_02025 [Patescibacteria group bacterium]